MWTSRNLRESRGYCKVECETCTHDFIVDLLIEHDGNLVPIQSEHCPECGANYDLDLYTSDAVIFHR